MDEVGAWLDDARARDALPEDLIQEFTMRLEYRITDEKSGRADVRHVELDCLSAVITAEGQYEGRSRKRELWTRTDPSAGWLIRDV